MRHGTCNIIAAIVIISGVYHSCSAKKRPNDITPYAQFIAGVSLLRITPSMEDTSLCIERYNELSKITETSAEATVQFLEQIKKNPRMAKQFHEVMSTIFTETPDSTAKKIEER